MDLRCLRTFLYTAEMNSFTKAGEELGYSQSTVSFQIRQLEEELGVRLFERVNRTVSLTDKGREVLQYAHQFMQLSRELELSLHQEKQISGEIRLAMADSLCPAFLDQNYLRFRQEFPDIHLKIKAAGTEEMFRFLNHNETDLVFTLDQHIYHTEYEIVKEWKMHTHFVASAGHPLAQKDSICIEELLNESFLLTEKGMSYRRLMDEKMAERSLEIHPVLEMGNADQICRLVEANAGISFLPDYVTKTAVQNGRIRYLQVEEFDVEIWLQLLHHRDKWISPAMKKIIEYCLEIYDRLVSESNQDIVST